MSAGVSSYFNNNNYLEMPKCPPKAGVTGSNPVGRATFSPYHSKSYRKLTRALLFAGFLTAGIFPTTSGKPQNRRSLLLTNRVNRVQQP